MIDEITDEFTEGWMLGAGSSITEEELLLLRNRIWVSWGIWLITLIAISAVLAGYISDLAWSILIAAFFSYQLTRLIRIYRRPKLRNWHVRRHLYRLTYLLPVIVAGLGLAKDDAPVSAISWMAFVATSYFLYLVQIKDDLKILKAIPIFIDSLRESQPSTR